MKVLELGGREYPPEAVWQAQELYCIARLTYAQVADKLGVGITTVKRWGKNYNWRDKRERFAQAQTDIQIDTVLARSELLKELIAEKNPVVGFAVAKLEELALKQAAAAREGRALEAAEAAKTKRREITTKADAVEALQEAVELKLARLLASPEDLTPKDVKGIKETFELIKEMQPKDSDKDGKKGVSRATIERIEKEILGM